MHRHEPQRLAARLRPVKVRIGKHAEGHLGVELGARQSLGQHAAISGSFRGAIPVRRARHFGSAQYDSAQGDQAPGGPFPLSLAESPRLAERRCRSHVAARYIGRAIASSSPAPENSLSRKLLPTFATK